MTQDRITELSTQLASSIAPSLKQSTSRKNEEE